MGDTTGITDAEVKELCQEPEEDTKVRIFTLPLDADTIIINNITFWP